MVFVQSTTYYPPPPLLQYTRLMRPLENFSKWPSPRREGRRRSEERGWGEREGKGVKESGKREMRGGEKGGRIVRRETGGRRRKSDKSDWERGKRRGRGVEGKGKVKGEWEEGRRKEDREEEVNMAHAHTHLVQHFIKVTQLSDLLHDLLPHEERCVDWSITLTMEEVHGIVDQRLLEIYSQGGK